MKTKLLKKHINQIIKLIPEGYEINTIEYDYSFYGIKIKLHETADLNIDHYVVKKWLGDGYSAIVVNADSVEEAKEKAFKIAQEKKYIGHDITKYHVDKPQYISRCFQVALYGEKVLKMDDWHNHFYEKDPRL